MFGSVLFLRSYRWQPSMLRIAMNINLQNYHGLNTFKRKAMFSETENILSLHLKRQTGLWTKIRCKLGGYEISKTALTVSSYKLYILTADGLNYQSFFKLCRHPDTFLAWFLVTELHIWMLMVRLMAENKEGRYARNTLVEALWKDVDERSKKIGESAASVRKLQISLLGEQFNAALFNYDEGLLGSDADLAGALWRRLFCQNQVDPSVIEKMVNYVRRQIHYLESLDRDSLILNPNLQWCKICD